MHRGLHLILFTLLACAPPKPAPTPEVETWPAWVSKLKAAVEWPVHRTDVVELLFQAELAKVRDTPLPQDGHQPWLNSPDIVASVDLRQYWFENGDCYPIKTVQCADGGEAMFLKHYSGNGALFPVHALVYRNQHGRCFTIAAAVSLRVACVEEIVADLGRGIGYDNNRLVAALHEQPHASARLLIRELQVVDPDEFPPIAWHVIWCIRALESLTNQEFELLTEEKLSAEQAEFLDPTRPMNYYGAWMSRSRFYLAPRSVQQKVIDAWKSWVREHGKDFKPAQEPRIYAP